MAPGLALDVPAGTGIQARALIGLGYRVVAADLFPSPKNADASKLSWVQADANLPLPFADASFDYVLSREGIEHLENQAGFIRECSRVLKPGATLVITTPNLMHLAARLSQFLTGQRSLRRGLVNEVQTLRGRRGRYLYHGHVFFIDYFRMRYLLRLAGFERLGFYTDRLSPTSLALAFLVPFLYGAARFSVWASRRSARRGRKPDVPAAVVSEILAQVHSTPLLFGKRMIVVARKSSG